eukprot:11933614-Alexandrium_andersonii.AAC.1
MPNLPTKRADGCAGGASRGGSGGRSPPGKTDDYYLGGFCSWGSADRPERGRHGTPAAPAWCTGPGA